MVFCNMCEKIYNEMVGEVTILILIDGFLQYVLRVEMNRESVVTILILIDGFLQ